MKKLQILNHTDNPIPEYIGGVGHSNAIDLYVAEDTIIRAGEFKLIDMGVSIKVPEGYKADLKPRSSTFKRYGIIQTNSVGLIDSTYSGADDKIMMPVFMPITSDDISQVFAKFVSNALSSESQTAGKTEKELLESIMPSMTRAVLIPKGTRICQLEILKCSDIDGIENIPRDKWNYEDRGGFGSTGSK